MRKVFVIAAAIAALCLGVGAHPAPQEATPPPLAKRETREQQLAAVYCPTRDCTGGRDWLVKEPSAAAGWAVGSVAFLAGGVLIGNSKKLTHSVMLELGISLFLRAGLNYEHGNKRAIYIASLFFNYLAATGLLVGVVSAAFSLKAYFDEEKVGRALVSSIFTMLVNLALFAMVVAGVVIMYRDETMVVKNVGWRLIQAVLYIMVILIAAALGVLLKSTCGGNSIQTVASLALLVAAVLMGVWSSFMLARTYLPLDSVARSSEVAFYLLNIAPLLIIGILF